MFKKKLTAVILLISITFTFFTLSSQAFDADAVLDAITANYSEALSLAGRSSFHGNCNLATAYQLRVLGVYDDQLDYSGGGNQWYSHYAPLSGQKTSGGYTIVPVGGEDCLYTLVETYGNELYNIVVSFGTGGASGPTHVMLITALVDGIVYFTDSFDYWGVHGEGEGGMLTIEEYYENYYAMNGSPFGCVYFTDNSADAGKKLVQSSKKISHDIESGEKLTGANGIGIYRVKANPCLLMRKGAGRQYDEIGDIPDGRTIIVTEIKDGWGKTKYKGTSGWVCLDYAILVMSPEATTAAAAAETKKEEPLEGKLCDVDGDGKVTATDARSAVRYSAKLNVLKPEAERRADVNGDGKVTATDARIILRVSANLEKVA